MPSKEVVLFDLDDTLCEYTVTIDETLRKAFDDVGVEPFFDAEEFRRWTTQVNAESPLDLRQKCFSSIAKDKGYDEETAYELAEVYDEPDSTQVELVSGAEKLLDRVSERYRVGLVTNGGEESQKMKLRALEISDFFDARFFATPDSPVKPSPEPFYDVLDTLGIPPRKAVHIGDSLESDVTGARNAGIDSVWVSESEPDDYQHVPNTKPDYVVNSIRELNNSSLPWE